jgi:hypothetical protein
MKKICFVLLIILITYPAIAQKKYKGAEYRTKEAYTYGRFEVRMKSAQREGMLASFFTYYDGAGGSANWNEIDIEILGRYNYEVQFNIITPGQTNHVRSHFVNFNPALDFHIYAIEWTPLYVAWFIDGEEVYRQTGAHIQTLTHPQKIMMNIWNPSYTNWIGDWNDYILPAFAFYDWVSYYSYTPGSGNYGTNNNFTQMWTDNFDNWDLSRWDKATHTFDGNNCDFIKDNASFYDGKLILSLTDNINTGYTDKVAPLPVYARYFNNKITVLFNEEIDKTTAEDKNNFIVPTINIDSVRQLPDQKSVIIFVAGIDPTKNYIVVTRNIKDFAPTPNISAMQSVPLSVPTTLNLPVKINVGGSATNGYLPDQEWNNKVEYGYMDGSAGQFSSFLQINGTDEDIIYQSERNSLVAYNIRIPNGLYNLKLMMAENYFSETGSRIFDIYVEGENVAKDLDIYKVVGKNSAYELNIPNVEVKDEILEINLASQINNSLLNGIVVEKSLTGMRDNNEIIQKSFSLLQNYPNPFNPSTTISYQLPVNGNVTLKVFNALGQEIKTLINGFQNAGFHSLLFTLSSSLPSGIYFYQLKSGSSTATKKLIIAK